MEGLARRLAEAEVTAQIKQWGKEFEEGAPNQRQESIKLAEENGFETDGIVEFWDELEAERRIEAKAEPAKAKPEEAAEPEPLAEADWIEDDSNQANDIRRKLWRMKSALAWLKPNVDVRLEMVGATLVWMGRDNRDLACEVFAGWAKDEHRLRWLRGFGGVRPGAEEIYRLAQCKGWRYPIAANLNKLDEMADRVEAAVIRAGTEIYQSGKRLVRPVMIEVPAAKDRKARIAALVGIDHPFLKSELTTVVDFFRWKQEQREGIGVPPDVVNAILARFGKWRFPKLTGVISTPTLRRDGSVLAKEGYDPATGLYVMGPLPKMPAVAARPTREEALGALGILDGLLEEFPWVNDASRSVGLSGLISPVVRAALTCVPLHAGTAPWIGTGKSYLFDTVAAITIGGAMPIIAAGKDTEELEKRIGSQVLEGISLWSLDNVSIFLGGDAICQVVEREMYKPRILGKSEMKEFRNTWTVFANGNNLRLRDDITRRTLLMEMDARMEQPWVRRFKRNPFKEVLADRGRYLWAVLTVVKAYQAAGMPGRLPWIGDPFGEWSDLVRSALVWLDRVDPVATMERVTENDPARQTRGQIFQAIYNAYGNVRKTTGEMVADAKAGVVHQSGKSLMDLPLSQKAKDLEAAIIQYTDRMLDAKYLGNRLNRDRGKIVHGLCLRAERNTDLNQNEWWVERL